MRIFLVIVIIVIALGVYKIFFTDEEQFSYKTEMVEVYYRLGVADKIYDNTPDSLPIVKMWILEEVGIAPEEYESYKNYLKENPEFFKIFLDSVESKLISLEGKSNVYIRAEVLPKKFQGDMNQSAENASGR
ncbi:MAG: hypothetical protein GF315_11840 [candidate division Zixibacteria bacterium]|nr:hypothetical protein [candidate division Zixibacteria bacterium]